MRGRELLEKPIVISAMPVIGAEAPATLSGFLLQSTAEFLPMNTVTLALDDRLNGWKEAATIMDLKTTIEMVSGPDLAMARLAYAQRA